jgi:hypothetical protein
MYILDKNTKHKLRKTGNRRFSTILAMVNFLWCFWDVDTLARNSNFPRVTFFEKLIFEDVEQNYYTPEIYEKRQITT